MKAGWKITTIDEIADVVTKGTTPTSIGHNFKEDGINFVKVESITSDGRFLEHKLAHISDECHQALRRSQIQAGDILFSIAGALGRTAIAPPELLPANTNQALSIIRLKDDAPVFTPYLAHALSSGFLLDQIEVARGGAAQQNLSLTQVKAFRVPLPPLEDQRRIVAVLDEAFAGLARARANAEANLADARELFSSLVDEVAVRPEWPTLPLKELASTDCSLSYGIVQPGDETASGLPIVRPVDLTRRQITLDGLKRISPDRASGYARTQLQGGELLLCVRGTTGTVGIAEPELSGANVTRGIVPIRFNDQMVPLFGYYQVLSGFVQKQIEEKTYGAALMQINIRDVKELRLSCPSVDEQKEAAERLERIAKKHVELLFDSEQKIRDLDDLRQSLLQKAFSGAL
ncbi:restriction endonuclease subunit S [Tritonibacter mobilis]|uniref:restriction endonuclease subunit S n=1 Tax=Tritonibacter mobilis TaxID=379347 RepID=UPI001CD9814B|nr:restriction endonuclease subunit S [Tritonibacter mobilis]MCA2009140.1 restriction endonuclease subunit S [Tritonibacter mobilis]